MCKSICSRKKAVLRVFESQHAAIRISPKPHGSSESVGCSRQRGAVADDLKAAGPTTKYNSWWHARLRRAGGEPVQQTLRQMKYS